MATKLLERLFGYVGAFVLGALLGLVVGPRSRRFIPAVLLGAAGLSLVATMALACLYAFGEFTRRTLVAIDTMARTHGVANSVGFALPALVAFALLGTTSRAPRPGMPLSRLFARGRVGPDFFARRGIVQNPPPEGLVDDLSELSRADFVVDEIDPEVRDFYEHTARYRLYVEPRWRPGFVAGGRLFRWFARRIGQLGLPLEDADDDEMLGRIAKLDDRADGRSNVRGWIRTYTASGEVVYAAAYAVHEERGVRYMNIAFPLPLSNMTSVLRVDSDRRGGMVLTTLPSHSGDQGIYLVTRFIVVRLPFDETITVWKRGEDDGDLRVAGATVLANHDMWLFGVRFLTLRYLLAKG